MTQEDLNKAKKIEQDILRVTQHIENINDIFQGATVRVKSNCTLFIKWNR